MKQIVVIVFLSLSFMILNSKIYAAEVPEGKYDSGTGIYTTVPQTNRDNLHAIQYKKGKTIDLTAANDLSAWTDEEGKQVKDWKIEKGVISRTGGKHDLFLKGDYKDFVLEFEFKIPKNGNSGVFYCGWAENGKANGYEYQVIDDLNRRVHPTMERFSTGGLYTMYHRRYNVSPVKLDEYNKGKIIVYGGHIEHWLNGQLAISVQIGTDNWKEHVSWSRLSISPQFGNLTSGMIAFQNHDNEVWYRNIHLTVLEPCK